MWGSPHHDAAYPAHFCGKTLGFGGAFGGLVGDPVGDPVGELVGEPVGDDVGGSVTAALGLAVGQTQAQPLSVICCRSVRHAFAYTVTNTWLFSFL